MPCDQSRVGNVRAPNLCTDCCTAKPYQFIYYYCVYVCVTRTETNASAVLSHKLTLFCDAFHGRTAPPQFGADYFFATKYLFIELYTLQCTTVESLVDPNQFSGGERFRHIFWEARCAIVFSFLCIW